jgi:hypothetical protein
MRITIQDDPVWSYVLIFLDDKLIKWPISANEEQGVILVYPVKEDGQPDLSERKGSMVKRVLYGRVDIVLKPNAPAQIKLLYEEMRRR